MSKKYAIGDVHNNFKGLKQVLERSPIQEGDTLIFLGDLVDGHNQAFEVIEYILGLEKIYNVILIKGNHDDYFKRWIDTGDNPVNWQHGQLATAISYMEHVGVKDGYEKTYSGYKVKLTPYDIPQTHINLFDRQINYYKDEENNLFVHGGFNRHLLLEQQMPHVFYWDRDLWHSALSFSTIKPTKGISNVKFKITEPVKDIFIGHTTTEFWDTDSYMKAVQIYNIDCGGGWHGRICMINVETKEAWYSDRAEILYPDFIGRT